MKRTPISIHSHFQPIVSLAHRRVIGYEALLRAQNMSGRHCLPAEAFALAAQENRVHQFDRKCLATHVRNFSQLETDDQWLFLNLCAETIQPHNQRSKLLEKFLKRQGLGNERIVLEILEDAVDDPVLLQEFVQYYREAGFIIAIDDFGTGLSNFDRIWQIEPHIVKLDRSMLVNARNNPKRQRWLSRCVALLRETGALVLLEGVETEDDALLTLDSECELAQGYYFAHPSSNGHYHEGQVAASIQSLHQQALQQQQKRQRNQERKQATLKRRLKESAVWLEHGLDFVQATQALQAHPAIERIYMLDAEGVQIVENLYPGERGAAISAYTPFRCTTGALWARRSYFRNALAQPGLVQVSAPYLGLPDATLDVTLSVALPNGHSGHFHVLCADLPADWLEEPEA
ncbi:sensor domain-containing phosphodiesterase [Desulfurispira natronophila]|uniref:EAL domain-containing protein (Putative c-di-GMP-specific phosphodiesterase class I) n=1 Tax=Desulfurispira natronophila TaxID=682562 RepID=A0A7W7Y3E5_9BACT|nr:EAL domain-containing protein [Desulfurispira natronophila]MBB5021293.1 EAL domain-containing protein (putative c-di-GMP-specific phosphodiesterase class I) [Desulfurispira natronophila]